MSIFLMSIFNEVYDIIRLLIAIDSRAFLRSCVQIFRFLRGTTKLDLFKIYRQIQLHDAQEELVYRLGRDSAQNTFIDRMYWWWPRVLLNTLKLIIIMEITFLYMCISFVFVIITCYIVEDEVNGELDVDYEMRTVQELMDDLSWVV